MAFGFGVGKTVKKKESKNTFGFGVSKPAVILKKDDENVVKKQTAGLPSFLGGGKYNLGTSASDLATSTKTFAGIEAPGQYREHIFPFALGGVSEIDNIKVYGKNLGAKKAKYENEIIRQYKAGKLSLPEARGLVLKKYREIIGLDPKQGVIANLPSAIKDTAKGTAKAVGNFFTGSSQKFGKTIGTALSVYDKETNQNRDETLKSTRDAIDNYLKLAGETSDKGKKELYLKVAMFLTDNNDVFSGEEYQKTTKQILGEALGTGLEITGFSTIAGKSSKAVMGGKELAKLPAKEIIKTIAKDSAKEALTVGAPLGASYAVSQAMQQNKTGEEITKEGIKGGLVGGVFQFGLGALSRGIGVGSAKIEKSKELARNVIEENTQKVADNILEKKTSKPINNKVIVDKVDDKVDEFGAFLTKKNEKGIKQAKSEIAKRIDQIIPDKKTQKLENRVYARLKDNVSKELQEDVAYGTKSLKQQAKSSIELIDKNPERAYRVALGLEQPKGNQTSASVNIALAEKARIDGNMQLYADLLKNRSIAQTKRGQEIVAEKLLTDNSVDRYVKEAINNRLESKSSDIFTPDLLKKSGKSKSKVLNNITEQAKKATHKIKDFDINETQKFIESITCK